MKNGIHLDQISLFTAINKEIARQYPKTPAIPRQVNAVIAAANAIVSEFKRGEVLTTPGMGPSAWLASDDVGMSSKFMFQVLSGSVPDKFAYPQDPDDFGRCRRLILAVPELAERISMLADHGAKWHAVASFWDEWVEMYDVDDECLYDAMQAAYA